MRNLEQLEMTPEENLTNLSQTGILMPKLGTRASKMASGRWN